MSFRGLLSLILYTVSVIGLSNNAHAGERERVEEKRPTAPRAHHPRPPKPTEHGAKPVPSRPVAPEVVSRTRLVQEFESLKDTPKSRDLLKDLAHQLRRQDATLKAQVDAAAKEAFDAWRAKLLRIFQGLPAGRSDIAATLVQMHPNALKGVRAPEPQATHPARPKVRTSAPEAAHGKAAASRDVPPTREGQEPRPATMRPKTEKPGARPKVRAEAAEKRRHDAPHSKTEKPPVKHSKPPADQNKPNARPAPPEGQPQLDVSPTRFIKLLETLENTPKARALMRDLRRLIVVQFPQFPEMKGVFKEAEARPFQAWREALVGSTKLFPRWAQAELARRLVKLHPHSLKVLVRASKRSFAPPVVETEPTTSSEKLTRLWGSDPLGEFPVVASWGERVRAMTAIAMGMGYQATETENAFKNYQGTFTGEDVYSLKEHLADFLLQDPKARVPRFVETYASFGLYAGLIDDMGSILDALRVPAEGVDVSLTTTPEARQKILGAIYAGVCAIGFEKEFSVFDANLIRNRDWFLSEFMVEELKGAFYSSMTYRERYIFAEAYIKAFEPPKVVEVPVEEVVSKRARPASKSHAAGRPTSKTRSARPAQKARASQGAQAQPSSRSAQETARKPSRDRPRTSTRK